MNIDTKMMLYIDGMAGRPSKKKPSKIGAHVAALRKQAGLSQAQLAQLIGMPQRTLSYYEREASDIPAKLAKDLAKVFGVTVAQVLDEDSAAKAKRGPKSKIERQLDAVKQLPKSEQQFVSKLLDNILTKKSS
jgi:transcriptional regulator with XRE-family HTH domain